MAGWAGLLLTAFAAASLGFAHALAPRFGVFVPGAILVAAAAQFATFAFLLVQYGRSRHPATAVLAASYGGLGAVATARAFTLALGPASAAVFPNSGSLPSWLALLWLGGLAATALVYERARPARPVEVPAARARGFAVRTVTFAALAAALAIGLPATLAPPLPPELGAFVVGALLIATTARAARGGQPPLESAFTVALTAATLDAALSALAPQRFAAPWYAAQLLFLASSLFIAVAAAGELVRWRERLERRLAIQASQAERHSQRLETVWRLAAATTYDDVAFLTALLDEGGRVLREGVSFYGAIAHVEGAELVFDVTNAAALGSGVPAPGDRLPLDANLFGTLHRGGVSAVWPEVRDAPWRAFLGTPFAVGSRAYAIGFAAAIPLDEPLVAQDVAYVETLAALAASRLHQRLQVDRLQYHSEHDFLTGVLNAPSFRARAIELLQGGRPVAVAVANIDRFQEVNENLGHQAGDAILVDVAAAFRDASAERDVVARLGGGTFGILLGGPRDRAEAELRVAGYAAAVNAALAAVDRAQRVAVTVTFGVALAPRDGATVEQLLARADAAASAAKEGGVGRLAFFDPRLEERRQQSRRLEGELRDAIRAGRLTLHFQPHVELGTGRIAGAEALVRWHHPQRGLLPPAEFVPFAEAHGLAEELGTWVLRETALRSQAWRRADPAFRVWFNLSAPELTSAAFLEGLARLGAPLDGLGVEITETAAMQDVDLTVATMRRLRASKLAIALDDFGTGYSSLAHLRMLPLDVVKIDRAFVAGLPTDEHDVAIVEAVVSISERYGFEIVAEGVETLSQVAFLAGIGCHYGQGYAYARPMPAEAFERWLGERSGARRSA